MAEVFYNEVYGGQGAGGGSDPLNATIQSPFIPVNQPITEGQTIQEAFESTQGQINALTFTPIEINESLAGLETKQILLFTKPISKDLFHFDITATDTVLTNQLHGHILHKGINTNGDITQEDFYFSIGDLSYTELFSIDTQTTLIGGDVYLIFNNLTLNPLTLTININ
jgi:hypothetical protein